MEYLLFLLGLLIGGFIVYAFHYFKDDYKQGYLDGFREGMNYEPHP